MPLKFYSPESQLRKVKKITTLVPMSCPQKILILVISLYISDRAYTQVDTIFWQQLSPLPDSIQRVQSGYFLIDSDFYVAGGQLGASGTISRVWRYHIPTDSWKQMSNLPFGGAACAASFVLSGRGYFLTARDSINNFNCDTMFWEYSPAQDTWIRRTGFPDAARQDASYFIFGGKGYVGETNGCLTTDSHFWQYDQLSNQWSQLATLPGTALGGSTSIATPLSSAYLFGGYNFNGNSLTDIWRYDIPSNHWDSIGHMPGYPRSFPVFWGFDSIIIGGAGEVTDTNYNAFPGNDYYSYKISNGIWTPIVFQNSFDSTAAGAAFIYNKKGYYFGGLARMNPTLICSNNLWSFDASRFFPPDTSTGITSVKSDPTFSLYPNPVSQEQGFSVSTSESGNISFYDALGRLLDERRLSRGLTQIRLATDEEIIFYRATLSGGVIKNGKVVFIR